MIAPTGPRVVGIGGGHGLAQSLRAALAYAGEVSAVVTVADDGGSSGRLTRELKIPPPGDIRNCLVALAPGSPLVPLFQHRFTSGALQGHAAGNLVIAALTEMLGDFAAAVEEAGDMVRAQGRVYPATTDLVELRARVDGGEVQGQVAVAQTKARIRTVYLHPDDPPACPGAVDAILAADQVLLGPGSLFTSLIATLLVPGVCDAVLNTSATRVFVCNNRVQPGETESLDASDHLDALIAHLGAGAIDVVLVQSPVLEPNGVTYDAGRLAETGVKVVEADVSTPAGAHDPKLLAEALADLL